jgi:hypothetical protein
LPASAFAHLLVHLILRQRGREQQRRHEGHERQEDSRARHGVGRATQK